MTAQPDRQHPFVYVDDLDAPELSEDDRRHLERSLRLRPGSRLTLSDGRGAWRSARLGSTLEVTSDRVVAPQRPTCVIAFAVPKGDRLDVIVQKTTEIGVTELVPLECERSVVRWSGSKIDRKLDRLARIVRSAGMQSRRCDLPVVRRPSSPADVVDAGAVLAAPGGRPVAACDVSVAIGPEGGWSDAELALCDEPVGLADPVLRIETAAIAAAVLVCAAASRSH